MLERAPELQAFGGAITIWFNGVAALDRLGVADEVEAAGETMEFQSMRSWRDRTLFEIPVGELAADERAPAADRRPPARPRELRWLVARRRPSSASAWPARDSSRTATESTVRLDDGTTERAAALIVADGSTPVFGRRSCPACSLASRATSTCGWSRTSRIARVPSGKFVLHLRPRRPLRDQWLQRLDLLVRRHRRAPGKRRSGGRPEAGSCSTASATFPRRSATTSRRRRRTPSDAWTSATSSRSPPGDPAG